MHRFVRGERSWSRYRSIRVGALLVPRLLDQDPLVAGVASQLLHGRGGSHYLGRTPLIYFRGNPRKSLREFPNPQQAISARDGLLGQHSSDQRGICRASFFSFPGIAIAIIKHARNEQSSAASNGQN